MVHLRLRAPLSAACLLTTLSVLALNAGSAPVFSSLVPGSALPREFHVVTLPKIAANKFTLVMDEGKTVLRVDSDNSAGSVGLPLLVPGKINGGKAMLAWRWKVDRVLEKADMESKLGDDFAARVYVFFDVPLESLSFADRTKIRIARMMAGADVPTAAICYVWDNNHRIGRSSWSPYTNRVRMIVQQSGPSQAGQWTVESRDLAADFKEAFGFDAPAVTGVAVGNDTDNTGERATAWFGDVSIGRK